MQSESIKDSTQVRFNVEDFQKSEHLPSEKEVNLTENEAFHTKSKMRFQEVFDERKKNLVWRERINIDSAFYNEVRETPNNKEDIRKAKERELENLTYFQVYDEVEKEDQHVLGTRYVVTQKPDGSDKARFIVKGFKTDRLIVLQQGENQLR